MSRWADLGALGLALLSSTLVGTWLGPVNRSTGDSSVHLSPDPKTDRVLRDATGCAVEARAYQRIVSLNTVADDILGEIIEGERVRGVSRYSQEIHTRGARWLGKPGLPGADIEAILALDPDLVLVSSLTDRKKVQRMRELGLIVFDLGQLRGFDSLLEDVRVLSRLVGARHRGERLVRRLRLEADGVSDHLALEARKSALYLGVHGSMLFGGSRGTSYADVIRLAGLRDAAEAAGYSGWPRYQPEQLLTIDPPWIVTNGPARALCARAPYDQLSACQRGQVVSLSSDLLSDPGIGMLDAARELHQLVYHAKPRASSDDLVQVAPAAVSVDVEQGEQ